MGEVFWQLILRISYDFIFLLFWFFDRTMVTQDMMGQEHANVLEEEEYNPTFISKYLKK